MYHIKITIFTQFYCVKVTNLDLTRNHAYLILMNKQANLLSQEACVKKICIYSDTTHPNSEYLLKYFQTRLRNRKNKDGSSVVTVLHHRTDLL